MKLVCTIGTQGLSDGRIVSRGEVYEVDAELAATFIASGNAQVAETDVPIIPVKEPEVVDDVSAPKADKKKKTNVNKRR